MEEHAIILNGKCKCHKHEYCVFHCTDFYQQRGHLGNLWYQYYTIQKAYVVELKWYSKKNAKIQLFPLADETS